MVNPQSLSSSGSLGLIGSLNIQGGKSAVAGITIRGDKDGSGAKMAIGVSGSYWMIGNAVNVDDSGLNLPRDNDNGGHGTNGTISFNGSTITYITSTITRVGGLSNYTQMTSAGILSTTAGANIGGDLDVGGTYTNDTQPAFLALNSGTDSNLAINTDVKIEFNSVTYDQASNFDNVNDSFTAPVTGKYLLTTQLRLDDIDTAADWTSIRIVTSNREYRRFIDPNFTADLNQFGMNMTVVADMDAGDTAHVEFRQSGGSAQVDSDSGNPSLSTPQLDTFFSGYLLG